jgi:hypothetical protein
MVEVHYDEGLATHIGSEPCVDGRDNVSKSLNCESSNTTVDVPRILNTACLRSGAIVATTEVVARTSDSFRPLAR